MLTILSLRCARHLQNSTMFLIDLRSYLPRPIIRIVNAHVQKALHKANLRETHRGVSE